MQLLTFIAVLVIFEETTSSQSRHLTLNDGGSSESSSGELSQVVVSSGNKPSISFGQAAEQSTKLRHLNGHSTHRKIDDFTHVRAANLSEASHSHKNVQVLNIGPINSNRPRPKNIAYVKFPKKKYPKKVNQLWGSYIWPRKDAPELKPLLDYSPESDEITIKIPKVKVTKKKPRINWRLGSDSDSEEKFQVFKRPHHPEDSSGPDSSSSSSESQENGRKPETRKEEPLLTTESPKTVAPKTPKVPPLRTMDDDDGSPEDGPPENDVYRGTEAPGSSTPESSKEKHTTNAPPTTTTETVESLDAIEKRKRNRHPNLDVTSQAPPDGNDDMIGVIPDESSCDKYAIKGTGNERDQEAVVAAGFRQGGSTKYGYSSSDGGRKRKKGRSSRHRQAGFWQGNSIKQSDSNDNITTDGGERTSHHHHHHHRRLSFGDLAPKFNMHRRRLATLINRMAPHCPEIHGPKLLSIWSQLFKHSIPNYTEKDESSKYSEDIRLQLGLCFQRMLDNNFGLYEDTKSKTEIDNTVASEAAKPEIAPDADRPKTKRSTVDISLLGQSFQSEVASPIINYFLDLPLIVENAIKDAQG